MLRDERTVAASDTTSTSVRQFVDNPHYSTSGSGTAVAFYLAA